MKTPSFLKRKKFWKWFGIGAVTLPILGFGLVILLMYWQQDRVVQQLITTFNEDFVGEIEIKDSHISPFAAFPHITIDLEGVKVWEGKDKHDIRPILEVHDAYIGFNLWNIITGNFDINFIKLEGGEFDLILHKDGSLNLANALESPDGEEIEDVEEELHMHLKSIQLHELDIHKYDEENELDIEAYVHDADASFKSSGGHIKAELESQFVLNVIDRGDTTFIRHKHFDINTHLDFVEETAFLTINPSEVILEHGVFGVDGTLDILDSLNLDLKIHGNKKNFDLLIAFAPEELIPTLEKYDNAGEIYFEGHIKGKSVDGIPEIVVDFGIDQAWLKNTETDKTVEEMHFEGHFANTLNPSHDLSAMEFSLKNIHLKPGAGTFDGNLLVRNFDSPEIDMNLRSNFNLDFLAKFLNVEDVKDLAGEVKLNMKFHDIIDLEHPEKSIEKLNEAYFTELIIDDLSFKTDEYHLPINSINCKISMDGHEADVDYLDIVVGNSDIHIDGMIDDLPAILHHTDREVDSKLNISSKFLDIEQLTHDPKDPKAVVDEQITNFNMKLDFKSSARAFTESKHLPEGEFFIEDFYAKMKHYPHTLHDFHADVFIDENDLRIIDFSGVIDTSDFHFIGKLHDYGFWFADTLYGDTRVEFDFTSDHLRLEDLFAYKGENHVPEDYRHEELTGLKIHGLTDLHFKNEFHSVDLRLTQFDAKMKIHPVKFEKFNGRIHYEDEHIQIDTLYGQIGHSSFTADLNYYIGDDEAVRKRDNHLGLHANLLDLDEILQFDDNEPDSAGHVDHEDGFNIYDLEFTPMTFDIDIKKLRHGKYKIDNLVAKFNTTRDHHINIEKLEMEAAGGRIEITGSFDGTDRNKIFLDPTIKLYKVDLDQLLWKFDNFGQDYVVSDQLHGQLSGTITGHIHVHPDLVPKIDDSEVHLDLTVTEGRLEKYEPIMALSDYFGDKNLESVKFDSLENHLDITNGYLNIPNMTLNTTLGHMDFEGKQKMSGKYDMEYYVRVPLKMVTEAAKYKLFGKKNKSEIDAEVDAESEEEEVVYKDQTKKRIRYMNFKVTGDYDDWEVSLGKKKQKKKKKKKQGT